MPLPGEQAQLKLAPMMRIEELKSIDIARRNPNEAAVMAVFYPDAGETNFVLILRKTYKGVHSNQVGFPGGRVEAEDQDLSHTALRETEEEVGIPRHQIQVLRALTRLYIPPSNFWVYPFLGIMEEKPALVPQETEVEEILEVRLADFLSDTTLVEQRLTTSYATNINVPAYKLNEQIVWGATGMMLSEIREMLRKV
ncbi:MAG: CoA pyrophosphatase [Christiangramia sp.]|uniref:NUDIX hydrolase n=1 Tax=Christiangramia sp. TaxID=1931228 RepID=UPI00324296F8